MMATTILTLRAVTPHKERMSVSVTQTPTLTIPTQQTMVHSDQPLTTPTIVSDLTTTAFNQTTTTLSLLDTTTTVLLITMDTVPPSETWPSGTKTFTILTEVQDTPNTQLTSHTEFYKSKKRMMELILLTRT